MCVTENKYCSDGLLASPGQGILKHPFNPLNITIS